MFYCEPKWHHKNKVHPNGFPADYHIQPAEENIMDPGFACCERHAGDALRIMLSRNKSVKVRRVNTRQEETR